MQKKTFITLLFGTIGGLLFSIGMCMALLPEWNMFKQGIICGAAGAIVLLITYIIFRKMSGKKACKINWKIFGRVVYGIFASLVLGTGMCMILEFEKMLLGIIVGVVGIIFLLLLIPMCLGWKEDEENKEKGDYQNE